MFPLKLNDKQKMYLAISIIMLIIIIAWILNLKNTLSNSNAKPSQNSQNKLTEIKEEFSNLLADAAQLKKSLTQSPTSTSSSLQPAAEISPQQFEQIVSKLTTTTDETLINTSAWKTYTNTKYGFEFKYPNNWMYTNGNLEKLSYYAHYKNAKKILILKPLNDKKANIDQSAIYNAKIEFIVYQNYQNLSIDEFAKTRGDPKNETIATKKINNNEITYLNLDGMNSSISALWKVNDMIYALEDPFNAYQNKIFNQILSTFKSLN